VRCRRRMASGRTDGPWPAHWDHLLLLLFTFHESAMLTLDRTSTFGARSDGDQQAKGKE
jgi:hypothetical protein